MLLGPILAWFPVLVLRKRTSSRSIPIPGNYRQRTRTFLLVVPIVGSCRNDAVINLLAEKRKDSALVAKVKELTIRLAEGRCSAKNGRHRPASNERKCGWEGSC